MTRKRAHNSRVRLQTGSGGVRSNLQKRRKKNQSSLGPRRATACIECGGKPKTGTRLCDPCREKLLRRAEQIEASKKRKKRTKNRTKKRHQVKAISGHVETSERKNIAIPIKDEDGKAIRVPSANENTKGNTTYTLVTCNKCDGPTVWTKSTKTGQWFLAEVLLWTVEGDDDSVDVTAMPWVVHSDYCGTNRDLFDYPLDDDADTSAIPAKEAKQQGD